MLFQVQERFLGCWGRKCNKYEWNYSSFKGELLAVIQCTYKEMETYTELPKFLSS